MNFARIIAYTREQAIADGLLIDVTVIAKEAGFSVPVAMTRAAHDDCVAWSADDNERKRIANDEEGRLWDVVYMAANSFRENARYGCGWTFEVYRVPRIGKWRRPRRTLLKVVYHRDDNNNPVCTIMQPHED